MIFHAEDGLSRAIPSPLGRDLGAELDRFLRSRVGTEPRSVAFFAQDHGALWSEIAAAGWTTVGTRTAELDPLDLLDLSSIAEVWGRHLIPLPLIETIIARLSGPGRIPADRPLSYAIPAFAGSLIPFGTRAVVVVTGTANGAAPMDGDLLDQGVDDGFAPSLPVTEHVVTPPSLPLDVARAAAVLTTSGAIGASAAALDLALQHARTREQFGRPIGAFQAVKHRLVAMHQRLELARSAIAWACAESSSVGEAVDSATSDLVDVTSDAIQVLGGIGFTWESPIHWYLRHVIVARRIALSVLAGDLARS